MKQMKKSSPVQIAQKTQTITELDRKKEELRLLTLRQELKEGLPHLHGFKLYKWQKDFIEAGPKNSLNPNKINLICAANQIGKSACNIIKMIHWATEPKLWPLLWDRRPLVFWYLLPTKDNLTTEFYNKWTKEFLPKGSFKDHPQYGWREEIRNKHIWAIHFNTGITVNVHSYAQDKKDLQGASVDATFADEEVPWDLMPELLLRINERDGYWNGVMTPTTGQEYWRRCFEVRGDGEVFPEAFKQRVSLYDCKQYFDGTPSRWTDQKINQTINRLGTQQEIDLRVHGRFVVQEGLKLPSFDRTRNVSKPEDVPEDWLLYSGVDIGSGGTAHPPAICFVAVKPDYTKARIIETWCGDDGKIYAATDILDKYIEIRRGRFINGEYYDWAAKDFGTIAGRSGIAFQPAEKSHEIGFTMLNSLFRTSILTIDDHDENSKLIGEIVNLRQETKKNHSKDNRVDAMRYAVTKIPWSFEGITGEKIIPMIKKVPTNDDLRRGYQEPKEPDEWTLDEEFAEWNSYLDPDFG